MAPKEFEVIVVGAGAVGLTMANLLGHKGISTLVLEERRQRKTGSRAIGITPPTLTLMARLGLDQRFLEAGIKVEEADVYGPRRQLGTVRLHHLKSTYPFILTLPQRRTEALLEDHLKRYPSVTLKRGHKAVELVKHDEHIELKVQDAATGREQSLRAAFLCACDGKNSLIREQLGIRFNGAPYPQTYLMADFTDKSSLGRKACFYFTGQGPVESFPLPNGLRRWLINTPQFMEFPTSGYLAHQVRLRTGVVLMPEDKVWETAFGVQHYLAVRYGQGRVLLCGDAAHIMSPIGGLGMNVGMMDADYCAGLISHAIPNPQVLASGLKAYTRCGQKAAKTAMRESAFNTYLGTLTNKVLTGLRTPLIQAVLRWGNRSLAAHYAMMTIPYCRYPEPGRLTFGHKNDLNKSKEE